LSWVKSVHIKRSWPNAVDITVLERHELARWNDGGLIDASGELFNGAADKKLPVLEGPVNQHAEMVAVYLRLMKILEPFKVSVDRLRLSRQQSWYGHLSSGLEVAMGEQNIESRLERFMRFLPDAESRFKSSIKYVDLRYTNGFSVSSSVNGGDGS
jgi:cell division protein FtsQ